MNSGNSAQIKTEGKKREKKNPSVTLCDTGIVRLYEFWEFCTYKDRRKEKKKNPSVTLCDTGIVHLYEFWEFCTKQRQKERKGEKKPQCYAKPLPILFGTVVQESGWKSSVNISFHCMCIRGTSHFFYTVVSACIETCIQWDSAD